jgi:hypothetical protein
MTRCADQIIIHRKLPDRLSLQGATPIHVQNVIDLTLALP